MEPKITSCNLKVENAMQEGLMAKLKTFILMESANLWINEPN
jgi:hypothetical protein